MTTNHDVTLDILYTNKLKYFQNNYKTIIPKLQKKIDELKEIINEENTKEINEKINEIETKISVIVNEKFGP
jgi:hypothetical protein